MAQSDDIKALQAQVKDLTERLEKLEAADPPAAYDDTDLTARVTKLEQAEPVELEAVTGEIDDSRLGHLADQVEIIRAQVNAPVAPRRA